MRFSTDRSGIRRRSIATERSIIDDIIRPEPVRLDTPIPSPEHRLNRRANHYTFNPSHYETASNRLSVARREMSPRSQLKNGGLNIAGSDIKMILTKLKQYSSIQIDDLNPKARSNFDRLVYYSQALYDTDDYETFFSWVQEEYGHLKAVYPGTVGAYMAGCMVSTSMEDEYAGCAISCAASIPRPRNDKRSHHCKNTVIKAEYDGDRYHFTIFKEADNPEHHKKAYLYINSSDKENYPGFSVAEKRLLSEIKLGSVNLEQVRLYGYNSDGREYVALSSELLTIDKLKSRSRHHSHHDHSPRHQEKQQSSSTIWWWVILIVIIFIVICVLVGVGIYWSRNINTSMNIETIQSD
jgi:hypothetical protein